MKNRKSAIIIAVGAIALIAYLAYYGWMLVSNYSAFAGHKDQTMEGMKFADFECEYNGQIQRLSDYVGNGKYVLVDFWASWCGPCRREIPNLINVYNKYKDCGFDVVGVASFDDAPEDSQRVINEYKIPYSQILNAQYAGSLAYGFSAIPQIILFGPDGTILRRDLRGEEIEQAVREALNIAD